MKWNANRYKAWLIRLTHWEYWSFAAVYYPIIWYWVYLSIRSRSLHFFNAANPGIEYGGFLMESKWDIYKILPQAKTPKTTIVHKQDSLQLLLQKAALFDFPIICKPDLGSRGRGVAVIHDFDDLEHYHNSCPLDYLIQEKIDYPMEAGIFYVRIPGEKKGRITGIVGKEFLTVTGDGIQTIEQLIKQNDRYLLQYETLKQILGEDMNLVPAAGEQKLLVPFGNHARGCKFIDCSDRINDALTNVIDQLCRQIKGFYFGRLDIRFESWEKLEAGLAFSIIELNGSGSEPTHMYDPANSLFTAWKEIIKHWKWLYQCSKANHKKGIRFLTYTESKKMFTDNKMIDAKLNDFIYIPAKDRAKEVLATA